MKFSKLGLTLSLPFLGLVLLASIPPITSNDPFSAFPLFLLASPWTFLLEPLVNALGYIQWYGQFSGSVDTEYLYSFFATLGILPGALINAAILYFLGKLLSTVAQRNNMKNEVTPLRKS